MESEIKKNKRRFIQIIVPHLPYRTNVTVEAVCVCVAHGRANDTADLLRCLIRKYFVEL